MPRICWSLLTCAVVIGCITHAVPLRAATAGWEPLPEGLLQRTTALVEPGAEAEVEARDVWLDVRESGNGFELVRTEQQRIKVYTQAASQRAARIDIPLIGKFIEDVKVEGRTILPDGQVIELDPAQVREETVLRAGRSSLRRRSFVLPQAQAGCVLEYRIRFRRPSAPSEPFLCPLQTDLPMRRVGYHIRFPKRLGLGVRHHFIHASGASTPGLDGYTDFVLTNQRSFQSEPLSPPDLNVRATLLLHSGGDSPIDVNTFWQGVGGEMFARYSQATFPEAEHRLAASAIVAGATDEAGKTRAIMEWMRREYRISDGFSDEDLRKAKLKRNETVIQSIRQRGGTPLDALIVCGALARACGLEARFVRLPDPEHGWLDPTIAFDGFLTGYQIAIRVAGEWQVYAPAEATLAWDALPLGLEGMPALICDVRNSHFVTTPIARADRSSRTHCLALELAEDGAVHGSLRVTLAGHPHEEHRITLGDRTGADVDSALASALGWPIGLQGIHAISLLAPGTRPTSLQFSARYDRPMVGTPTGKRLLLSMSELLLQPPPRLLASERRFPVQLPYAWTTCDTVEITLPAGWKVETMDAPGPVQAPGVIQYAAAFATSPDGRRLTYTRQLAVGVGGRLSFPQSAYPNLRQLFEQIHERDRAFVTLIRDGNSAASAPAGN